MSAESRPAAVRGVAYLVRSQAEDGHWEDYRLPVGVSDAWVTAYVGSALVDAGVWHTDNGAQAAVGRAARWLAGQRPYPCGWGYNGITGPDADSTALALTLLRAVGVPTRPEDEQWLRARWRPGGGFATFEGPEAWGKAHADVTPAAYLALSAVHRAELREELIAYLLRQRLLDGTWPAYWWRSNLYSTRACLELLLRLGVGERLAMPGLAGTIAVQSVFELALVIEISTLRVGSGGATAAWAGELLERQQPDGSWPGGYNLRVTDPSCATPWERPVGQLYRDDHGLVTTATAVRALARLSR